MSVTKRPSSRPPRASRQAWGTTRVRRRRAVTGRSEAACSPRFGAPSRPSKSRAISWALLRGDSSWARTARTWTSLPPPPISRGSRRRSAPPRLRSPPHPRPRNALASSSPMTRPDGSWVKLDVVTDLAFGRYQELRLQGAAGCLAAPADRASSSCLPRTMLSGRPAALPARPRALFTDAHRRSLLDLADQASRSRSRSCLRSRERVSCRGGRTSPVRAGDRRRLGAARGTRLPSRRWSPSVDHARSEAA